MRNICICDTCGKQEKSPYMTIAPSGWIEVREGTEWNKDFCSLECLAEFANARVRGEEVKA